MAEKIVIEAEVKSNIGEVSKETKNAAAEFKIMGVSLNGVKAGFASAAVTAKGMFGTIKAGLISTGLGAFVVLVGSLATFFTNTKRGADKLTVAFTAMGAIVDVLKDRLSKVGEALSFIFSGEFMKAGEALKGTFSGITDEINKEVTAMVQLKKRTQELRDADNEFMVQKAATRQEIEKARLNAEDETKSAKERLDALKTALKLEEKTTNRELELAAERLAIQKEEMALSENSAEDEARLSELKVQLIEKETASIKMRRRVVTEVNALEREIIAEEKARAKEKQDIIDEEFDAKIKANDEWNKEQQRVIKEVADAEKKAADDAIKLDKLVKDAKTGIAKDGLNLITAIAGEGSKIGKAAAVASATISGVEGVQNAFTSAQKSPITTVMPAYPFIQAGLAGAFSAIQIQKILSGTPAGGGGGGGGAAPQTPAPQMMSGAFELSGGVAPDPVQAFVVTDEMTNSQNQLANIRRRATI
jgi:hypothetical protein